jgi:small-conductance mechanosensitive channel
VKKAAGRIIDRVDGLDKSRQISVLFAGLIIWLVGFEIAMHLLGLNLSTVFAASGFLAFGAGFAAKNIVENFLSGIILRVEGTIRPGDVIVINEKWMTVSRIGSRATIADTFDGEEILIPNSTMTQSMVINLTRRDKLYRLQVNVGVAYESDLKKVRQVLEEAVKKIGWHPESQSAGVYLHEFADSSVIYTITIWVQDLAIPAIESRSFWRPSGGRSRMRALQ